MILLPFVTSNSIYEERVLKQICWLRIHLNCLQFTVNKLMQLTLFCLLFLFGLAFSQALTIVDQIESISQSSDVGYKMMQYFLQSYPQLYNCTLLNRSIVLGSENKELGLLYNHFIFSNKSYTYTFFATLSLSAPHPFISVSPLAINAQGSTTFTSPKENSPKKYTVANNTILKRKEVGGYQIFLNTIDSRLDKAESFIHSLHPYMNNYWREFIQYEIVSGVNFLIHYIGFDSITTATVGVNINLDQQPLLLTFQIHCQLQDLSNLAIPCTDDLALKIFNANQILIIIHPQLLSYRLISMVSDDIYSPDGIMFINTFEDQSSGTRIMVQLNIEDNGLTILSYYIYKYPFG